MPVSRLERVDVERMHLASFCSVEMIIIMLRLKEMMVRLTKVKGRWERIYGCRCSDSLPLKVPKAEDGMRGSIIRKVLSNEA